MITLALAVAACLLVLACERTPSQTVPNLPWIISSLKSAKDTSGGSRVDGQGSVKNSV